MSPNTGKRPGRKRIPVPVDVVNRTGLCACGCGEKTPIATGTNASLARYAGFPLAYVRGHNMRHDGRANAARQRKKVMTKNGYWKVMRPDHPNADANGYVAEHRLIMSEALGRALVKGETVHHINGVRTDNRLKNLQLRQGNHGPGASFRCRTCGSHDVEAMPL